MFSKKNHPPKATAMAVNYTLMLKIGEIMKPLHPFIAKSFIAFLILTTSSLSQAEAPPFLGCTALGCIGKSGSIYADPAGEIKITAPDGVDLSPLGCTLSGTQYFTLKRTHPSFLEIYSMVLAAQASGKNIFLRAVQGSADCEVYYATIYP